GILTACRGSALVLGVLLARAAAAGVGVDPDEVRSVLEHEPWVTIADSDHVKFGADAWKGAADLSFRYRLVVRDGALYLWVDVTDDHPGVFTRTPLVLDHVELWIADPALAGSYAGRRAGIQATIAEFEARTGDGDCDGEERGFLAQERAL